MGTPINWVLSHKGTIISRPYIDTKKQRRYHKVFPLFSGGMWGSNPRHSEPRIRFRNLLNFSSLTNQFIITFCLLWDIFGTVFHTK